MNKIKSIEIVDPIGLMMESTNDPKAWENPINIGEMEDETK